MTASAPARVKPAAAAKGSDFSVLVRQIQSAGLLDRRRGSYIARIGLTIAFFAATWGAVIWLGNSWFQLILAVVMGLSFTQIAFLGHDGGHRQIFAGKRPNDLVVLISGNLLIGLSFGWWVDKHNKHHANPNKEGLDPDIGDAVFAFTTNQAGRSRGRLGRLVLRRQAWLFFPTLMLEGLHLHIASVVSLVKEPRRHPRRLSESILLSIHLVTYVGGLFLIMSPVKALLFIVIHQAAFGLYLGCSFAPNHKGMQTMTAEDELDFLRRQVLTSRNVRGSWWVDLVLGGLNYQVEHHLFPSMPRPSLRKAQHLVQAHCTALQIPYVQTGMFASYRQALEHLNELGAPLRTARATASSN
jgi:fatty acid desaturase